MHRSRPAKRHPREMPRVTAALDRRQSNSGGHAGIDDLDDAERRIGDGEAERPRDVSLERGRGTFAIELHGAAEEVVGVEAAEGKIRVRHGWRCAATSVGGRTRLRARAPWADAEEASGIDPSEAASAGADRVDVEH